MSKSSSVSLQSSSSSAPVISGIEIKADAALLFDCDGVIVETEELHRNAYNLAFERFGLTLPSTGDKVVWDIPYYDILQNTIGGGKPKMHYYFNNDAKEWPKSNERDVPKTEEEQIALVDDLQACKTECYIEIVKDLAIARPGVLELMDAAIADPTVKVGICSAATRGGFNKILESIVGMERANKLDVIIAGDDVSKKKPDPMIYNKAQGIIDIPKDKCLVIEDSIVGLKAAKAADMKCIITYTDSTATEDFYGLGAEAKVPDLSKVSLPMLMDSLRNGEGILEGIRDPKEATSNTEKDEVVSFITDKVAGWGPHFTTVAWSN